MSFDWTWLYWYFVQQQLRADFEAHLDGFSPNVREILDPEPGPPNDIGRTW